MNEDLLADAERYLAAANAAAAAASRKAVKAETVSRPGRAGTTFGQASPADDSVREGAQLVTKAAADVARAAFLLNVNLKLARSTNTFRAWQQLPAWFLAASGAGLAFLLGARDVDNPGGWVAVALMLILSVVVSFRGPADVQIGSGPQEVEQTASEGGEAGEAGEAGEEEKQGQNGKAPDAAEEPPAAEPSGPAGGRARAPQPKTSVTRAGTARRLAGAPDGVRILATGLDFETRKPLLPVFARSEFAERLHAGLTERTDELKQVARETTYGSKLRGERERKRTPDLGNPLDVGWTFLVAEDDERRPELVEALRPLAERRAMKDPASPLLFDASTGWDEWLTTEYQSLGDERPYYVLVVGGPDRVPFHFQALLDSTAAVGRVDFDTTDELAAYAEKLVRLESAPATTLPEAFFFAPDGGPEDATFFSRRYLAEPLAQKAGVADVSVSTLYGAEATKANLVERLRTSHAALVYTASHGIGAPGRPLEFQRQINGAVCCQDDGGDDWLFAASDVPPDDEPFLEGAIFFQFACFGYGTPAESDFMHWLGGPALNAEADFVAALPKRLLAHPRGPIAFVGHVDTAWLHGFDDPDSPLILQPYHERLAPFSEAVQVLLTLQPAGLALSDLNKRFDLMNGYLANELDRMQKGKLELSDELVAQLAEKFIFRSDAQNYMVLGDPAAGVHMPE